MIPLTLISGGAQPQIRSGLEILTIVTSKADDIA